MFFHPSRFLGAPRRAGPLLATLLLLGLQTPGQAQQAPAPAPMQPPASAADDSANRSSLPATDRAFIEKAMRAGTAEAALGRMGVEQAGTPPVRAFSSTMVRDHSRSNEELSRLAAAKGVAVNDELDPALQQQSDRLTRLSGVEFDRAFMAHMVDAHRQAVADFQQASRSSRDPEVKAFAQRTLPVLRQHLQHAQRTLAQLNRATGGAGGSGAARPASAASR